MSTSSSDAGDQISTCLSSLAVSDPSFLQCVIGSGAFVTRSGQVVKQMTAAQLAALTAGTIPPGDFNYICPISPESPSSACCSASARAQVCSLSPTSRSDPVLRDCKNMMDQVLWQTYNCSAPASTIVASVLGIVVILSLVLLRVVVYRPRSRIWQRQLWALIVKNVAVWRRAAGRQLRSILFALLLIGALVAVNELTGDAVSVVSVAPSLGLAMEFRGPSPLRAELLQKMRPVAGLLFLIAVTYPITQVVIAVVLEKEQRIREAIRVTGVQDAIALIAWAVSYLVAFLPLAISLALLTHYGEIFPNTPVGTLILLFVAFLAASTALCLALSAFFSQTRPAIIGTLVIIYLTHFMTFLATSSSRKQGLVCLLAPACLAVAVSEALADGSYGSGFQRAFARYVSPSLNLSTPAATAIMFTDVILYYILAWYLDQVVPQKIGARRPWHFPFHRSYWFAQTSDRHNDRLQELPPESTILSDLSQDKKVLRKISMRDAINLGRNSKAPQRRSSLAARIEDVDPELENMARMNQCVDVLALSRHYKVPGMATERVAVNQITMTLYSGQITSILGHNGAGKTTLISMLCGLVHPTSGDAIMYGCSLRRDLGRIRRSLGMCPQHDILFPDLTTKENLGLFAWLKGTAPSEIDDQAKALVTELGLFPKMDAKVRELSGGQRRKLCVAIALIGGSKVVFLDEPTAGMDPYSRRQTWDVLLNHRKGRVMVLTTHFMDEADILSDRIAIVADGDLCCLGSSLFLKTLYGGGYRLSISMSGSIRDSHKAVVASSGVRDLVLGQISGAQLRSSTNQGQDLMFQLPLSEAAEFPDLFQILDGLSDRLEYGVSVTTLEDVFLAVAQRRVAVEISQQPRVASVNMEDPRAAHHRRRRSSMEVKVPRQSSAVPSARPRQRAHSSCMGRVLYQMVLKRWWLARRDYRQPIFLIVLPLAFLLVPVIIPDIQITPILRPGPGAYPTAGPSSCSVEMAIDKSTSCSGSTSTCLATDSFGNDVQVRPQFVNVADLATKCTLHTYMGFCKYIPWICSADVCCNWRDPRSPWYPCQTWTIIPSKITSKDQDANWNVYCPRREYVVIQGVVNGFIKAMAILMAFVFAPAIVIAHAVSEVETGTKFLQLVSGVRLLTYWLGATIWDQIVVGIGVALAIVIMALYSFPLGSVAYFPALVLVLLFALSAVPMAYSASFSFKASSRALTALLVFHIVSGAGLGILNYILQTVTITLPNTSITTTDLANHLRYVLMVLPAFALTDGLLRLQNQLYTECVGDARDRCFNQMPPSSSDIWKNCLYLIVVTIIFWIGVIRREGQHLLRDDNVGPLRRRLIEMICGADDMPQIASSGAVQPDDEDVVAERRHVKSMIESRQLDPLVIAGMHKSYRRANTQALHPLYLSISAGQCLGFLGINGAGKTTTIRCLTGAVRLSGGHALIDGYDIVTDLYEVRRRIGFCPQYDALFERLTVRQHLIMYCRIRRMRLANVADVIDSMQLGQFAEVPAGFLSGGNRRKLSAAIALLGSPRVVYLDEPSTGMDPHAKRFLWKQIANVAGSGRTAIMLTTHSMEECEALCSKVAILMGGRLVGLGSIQHLKTRFGTGYTIEVRTKAVSSAMIQAGRKRLDGVNLVTKDNLGEVCERLGDHSRADKIQIEDSLGVNLFLRKWIQDGLAETVITYIGQRLPEAHLKSHHGPHMLFEIRSASLADLFAIMATADGVEHYAISQTTLEEIFNGFAQLQQPR